MEEFFEEIKVPLFCIICLAFAETKLNAQRISSTNINFTGVRLQIIVVDKCNRCCQDTPD